jgi:hypothetical protein
MLGTDAEYAAAKERERAPTLGALAAGQACSPPRPMRAGVARGAVERLHGAPLKAGGCRGNCVQAVETLLSSSPFAGAFEFERQPEREGT